MVDNNSRHPRTPPLDPEAISEMSYEELSALLPGLELDAAQIRASLEEARSKVATGGGYSDPDWYRRANFALRMKGREMQMVQRELGVKKREQAKDNVTASASESTSWERKFVYAARSFLSKKDFDAIVAEAEGRE